MSRPSSRPRAMFAFACLCSSAVVAAGVMVVAGASLEAQWHQPRATFTAAGTLPIVLNDTFDEQRADGATGPRPCRHDE